MLLKSVKIRGRIEGSLLVYSMTQQYMNDSWEMTDIAYNIRLPYGTSFLGLTGSLGRNAFTGILTAEDWHSSGNIIVNDNANVLVRRTGTNLYVVNPGPICPGEALRMQIHCVCLAGAGQAIKFCMPSAFGERKVPDYMGATRFKGRLPIPDTSFFDLELVINRNMLKGGICSPTHAIDIERIGTSSFRVSWRGAIRPESDMILSLRAPLSTGSGLRGNQEKSYSVCDYMQGNREENMSARLILKMLADCSASMAGESMGMARKALRKCLLYLERRDLVSYSRFGSTVEHMLAGLCACTAYTLSDLSICIDNTEADLGGTAIEDALLSAIRISRPIPHEPGNILLITDGDKWNTGSALRAAIRSGHRIFILGVGAGVSANLMREFAQDTGGYFEMADTFERLEPAIDSIFRAMRKNTDLYMQGANLRQRQFDG